MNGEDVFAWSVLVAIGLQLVFSVAILLNVTATGEILANACG